MAMSVFTAVNGNEDTEVPLTDGDEDCTVPLSQTVGTPRKEGPLGPTGPLRRLAPRGVAGVNVEVGPNTLPL